RALLTALIGLLVVTHLAFFALEGPLWKSDAVADVRKSLGFGKTDRPEVDDEVLKQVAKVAANQGLSNAFLAAGLAWGLWGLRAGRPEGRPVLAFFLGFIALAGVVGFLTIHPDLAGAAGFLIGQTGLALAALACLWTGQADRGGA